MLVVYVVLALGISFLCSLLESALLSARTANISERAESGSRGAALLLAIKNSRLDDAISAVLTLNTISNTAGAALAGNEARALGDAWAGVFAAVLTLLVLFLAEIPPKTLGAVYTHQLTPFVGWTLHVLTRVMAPILVLTRGLTRLLARNHETGISRREISAVITMATQQGALEREEGAVFSNLLRFQEIKISDVMTPRTVTVMVSEEMSVADFLDDSSVEPFSRLPVFGKDKDDTVGYVLKRQVLEELVRGADRQRPIGSFLREVWYLPETGSVLKALRQFLDRREHMALVTDEHGGVSGLVTLEDLVETILGVEIMDESDRHADLRAVASEVRERRLERLKNVRRIENSESTEGP